MLGALVSQVDVFSFGVVLWEIWTLGDQPYPNLSLQEIFAGVMTGTLRPEVPPGCDPAWVSLMQVSGAHCQWCFALGLCLLISGECLATSGYGI
jgi:hypothetical protein